MLGLALKSSKSLGPNYSALDDQIKLEKRLCLGLVGAAAPRKTEILFAM